MQEYLLSITTRPKWRCEYREIAEGDLVLVMSDNLPRGRWPLARVMRTVRVDDGRVHAVELKTKTGVYVRPVKSYVYWKKCPTFGRRRTRRGECCRQTPNTLSNSVLPAFCSLLISARQASVLHFRVDKLGEY